MLAKNLISETVPPLRKSDNGEKALQWMHEFAVHQLPIVHDGKLLNLISMEDVINAGDFELPVAEYKTSFAHPFVFEYAHILEVVRLSNKLNIGTIPVLDEEENYVGLITAEELLKGLNTFSSLQHEGSIIELEMPLRNYSLYEIARIVESNELQILSCFTNIRAEVAVAEVTLKLNSANLSALVAAFERHGILVKAVHQETEYTEDLKERYDSFMRYLNV
ncbi:MAG: CBS domain-containing protein [Chitinophagales bacterium]